MNNLCDLCLKDVSQCKNRIDPCSYVPKYNLCPTCGEKISVYEHVCGKCGYNFKAESEEK